MLPEPVDMVSLILAVVGVTAVPITVYLGLRQPIFLRKVKKELFLTFLGTYYKPIGDFFELYTPTG